eukprot:3506420-Pleurochrysis_carterae.AAC.1
MRSVDAASMLHADDCILTISGHLSKDAWVSESTCFVTLSSLSALSSLCAAACRAGEVGPRAHAFGLGDGGAAAAAGASAATCPALGYVSP